MEKQKKEKYFLKVYYIKDKVKISNMQVFIFPKGKERMGQTPYLNI